VVLHGENLCGEQIAFVENPAGHPTTHALSGDGTEESLPRTIGYWHRRESTGILAFNLAQQRLNIYMKVPKVKDFN